MPESTELESGLSQTAVEMLINRHKAAIAELVPEGRTFVSGSTLLGHYGGHDVDLVVLVEDVADAAGRMRREYAPLYEDEWRDDWAAFREPGPPQVDVVLTRSGTKGHAHHLRAWERILEDDALTAEYERLHAAGMDSVQKAAFFDSVVARLD
jgi:hypothetical protein